MKEKNLYGKSKFWVEEAAEEARDYQYFKRYDLRNLKRTLETVKRAGYLLTSG